MVSLILADFSIVVHVFSGIGEFFVVAINLEVIHVLVVELTNVHSFGEETSLVTPGRIISIVTLNRYFLVDVDNDAQASVNKRNTHERFSGQMVLYNKFSLLIIA